MAGQPAVAPPGCRFTTGEVEEALSIMREAAGWLADTGRPMWRPEELTRERLQNPAEQFVVLRGANSAGQAAMLLSWHDPFFWPGVPAGASGFIHKLAVRRAHAGQGVAAALVGYAAAQCRRRGAATLRLDCDPARPGLCAFYERCGFTCEEVKTISTPRLGVIRVAMYVMAL